MMEKQWVEDIEQTCRRMRYHAMEMIYLSKSGHPGASMSAAEILATLYFRVADITMENVDCIKRDKVVLSKGHGAPILYAALIEKGFVSQEEKKGFRKIDGLLQGHPCKSIRGVDSVSGSLGGGASVAVGMAKAMKIGGLPYHVYAVLGDGELNEGIVWESVMTAAKYKLDNYIAVVDYNKYQNDGKAEDVMPLSPLKEKWEAFGFETRECDGHDIRSLAENLELLRDSGNGKPKALIANTVKGKGVSYLMADYRTHYVPPTDAQWESAQGELL